MKKSTRKKGIARPVVAGTGLVALDAVIGSEPSAPIRYWAGGTCGNVLLSLSYLGWSAKPVARLGDDRAAALVRSDFRRWGVSERFIRADSGGGTPIIVEKIRRNAAGQPKHSFSWRCSDCGSPFAAYRAELATIAEEIGPKLEKTQVFFFDRASAGAIILARAAAKAGALVMFEPCGIGNPIQFRQAWQTAHVVKYSHERLSELPEMNVESSPLLVIETLGDAGLRYRHVSSGRQAMRWVDLEAIPVEGLQDSAGAGDWCTAGFLSKTAAGGRKGFARASNDQIRQALRYGQALASWNCRYEGARGGMYAVSKAEFHSQVGKILSGERRLISKGPDELPKSVDAAGGFCRACELSAAKAVRKPIRQRGTAR